MPETCWEIASFRHFLDCNIKYCRIDMGQYSTLRIVGSDLHHSGGQVGTVAAQAVGTADDGITAEDMGPAVFAAQHCPLGESCQPIQAGGPSGPDHRVSDHLIIKGDVDAVVVVIKSHRLHIDVCVKKGSTADPGTGAGIQNGLGSGG